ncbi:hypothetical protein LOTGIDRAFT_167953 [Lottia gigantea]|uniref:Ataxin-10 n=1 Tax=Lottia gigantea TaxID=225164 RepID=V3ZW41_LOTGI|nr:hypothetical protein LOTGIDRAFT_167953 [Lottia gigantea]ESO85166.1 hypothetical protein LOTGIDRAFT_167953 [Lottia gigantea]
MDIFTQIKSNLECQNWSDAGENFSILTKKLQDETFRLNHGKDVFKCADTTIKSLCPKLSEITKRHHCEIDFVKNQKILLGCFRALRNSCAGSHDNQDLIFEHPDILTELQKLFQELTVIPNKTGVVELLRCAVQFLGNLCVGNIKTQSVVWRQFLPCISVMVNKVEDVPLTNYSCMFLHTCLLTRLDSTISTESTEFYIIITCILNKLTQTDIEWGLFVIEDIFLVPDYFKNISHQLENKEWIFLVEVMINALKATELNKKEPVHMSNIECLCSEIINNSYRILSVNTDYTDSIQQKSLLLCKMIEALGIATSSLPDVYPTIQHNTELLTTVINLLKGIDEVGKAGGGVFSSVEKLSEINQVDTDHPVYGLKRDVVRLIANMVIKHRDNQDTVRTLDGIPLLLDQSNMDGKNPCILSF